MHSQYKTVETCNTYEATYDLNTVTWSRIW